jgi:hypothetical protein
MVSEMLMEDFLKQGDELLADLLLQGFGEAAPEASGGAGHESSHSFSRANRSRRAAVVNCVRRGEALLAARLVAWTGMRKRMKSR